MERRIRVDHRPQPFERNSSMDGDHERRDHLAARRADGRCADQHTAVGVGDQFDEAVVSGAVDPAAGRRGQRRAPDQEIDAGLRRLRLCYPDAANLRISEGDPGQRFVLRGRHALDAKDVGERDLRLVHRDVG